MDCSDKTGSFATGAQARAALRRIRRRGAHRDGGVKPTRAYPCECGRFHLTSEDYDDSRGYQR